MIQNTRLLDAIALKSIDRPPVWLMRQAGRYLPEYRKIRAQVESFLDLCKTPELACEVTLQPIRRFDLDGAIIFSDIMTIPEAMGMELQFQQGIGPVFTDPISHQKTIDQLCIPAIDDKLHFVTDAINLTHKKLNNEIPLIGFTGSPFTLATYMVEGKSSKQFNRIRRMLYKRPDLLHRLLTKLAQTIEQYVLAQVQAGADVIMMFDTWGGLLTPETFKLFSLNYMQRIVQFVHQYTQAPIILFTKEGSIWLESLIASGADAISLDWHISMKEAKQKAGNRVCLQGNMDPAVLYGSKTLIKETVHEIIHEFGQTNGHIFNLGHGVYPDIDPDNVATMVEAVKNTISQKH